MSFDMSQVTWIYDYFCSNGEILFDIVLILGTLYASILYFNIGIVNIIFRLLSFVISFLLTKLITPKVVSYFGGLDTVSSVMLGLFFFFLFAYFLYKQVTFLTRRPVSWLDSLVGGIYGICEVFFFIAIFNTSCRYAYQHQFPVPTWILDANGITTADQGSQPAKHNSISYQLLRLAARNTKFSVNDDYVSKVLNWVKGQLSVVDNKPQEPGIQQTVSQQPVSQQPILATPVVK